MPYIYVQDLNAKLLIDTGSERSFISNKFANKYFSNHKIYEPFSVKSTHSISNHDQAIILPMFVIFKFNLSHKFYIYDIDDFYDGLIGIDLLRRINASIDLVSQKLLLPSIVIPIYYNVNSVTAESFYMRNNDSVTHKLLTENLNKLRLEHIPIESERNNVYSICYKYKDIFYCEGIPLTFTHNVKHHIRTTDENPIYVKQYRQSPSQAEEIKRQVQVLLSDNIIQPSYSAWSAPVHLVPKKLDATGEQKFRMVIDYRKLNEKTINDKYPIPNITDLFDKLGKSKYFTTLDLASGYHQIEIAEEDRPKTAFTTQNGHYEFLRMPFGLKTAPATFQRTMDNVLRHLQGQCLTYLDDIIVYSETLEEHYKRLNNVFNTLKEFQLKVQLDKSEFLKQKVLYLGHIISEEGLKPNDEKIKSVLNYPIPKTTKQIKSFLGLIGYYRKFIKDFAKITKPLTNSLRKDTKIIINDEYVKAFEQCKDLLINAPLLQHPDFSKPFIVTTDASDVALGAVLSQGKIGNDRPIAYISRTLNIAETKYSTIEKELLAVVWALKYFRPYLYGHKFLIYTDHRPLAWLYSLKEPNSKLTRWRLRLQEYDFEIFYRSGKQNSNADALSRIQINTLTSAPEPYLPQSNTSVNDESDAESEQTVSAIDSDIFSENELENENNFPVHVLDEPIDVKPRQIIIHHWFNDNIKINDLSKGNKKIIEIFTPSNTKLIQNFLKDHLDPNKRNFVYFNTKQIRDKFLEVISETFDTDEISIIECTKRITIVESEEEQKDIVLKLHDGKTCHRGINETLNRLKRNYYWKGMKEMVTAIINSCDLCKKMKYDRNPLKPVIQFTQTQNKPFEEIFIDLFSIEGKGYLTVIDAFSKLGQSFSIDNRSTPEIVKALMKYFSYYGTPLKINCDPGSEFNNALLKDFLILHKVDLHIGTPNNPNSMGLIERFHSTLIEIYRLAKYEKKFTDVADTMTYALIAYNNSIHSTTGFTPFEVVFGHTDSKSVFDIQFNHQYMQRLINDHRKRTSVLYKYISDKVIASKAKIIDNLKDKASTSEFEKGNIIYSKLVNKRKPKDSPRYDKAVIIDEEERNIIPVKIKDRVTKVPVRNVKRPSKK